MLSWLPEDISTFGPLVDQLFYIIYYLTLVTFILVMAFMITILIRYRRKEGRRAMYMHGNTTLEIIWTIVPAMILIVLGYMSKARWDLIKENIPVGDVQVRVTGQQFNWEVRYPGPDGKFDTADDLQMENELHVPVNKVVRVHLRSKDVIHSFFVPVLRLKQDAVPGREILSWFEATKVGQWEIPCAQLCGFGHSGMKGLLIVQDPADYEKWVKEHWPTRQAKSSAPQPAAKPERG
jgi:cytochrome c oxidase subunit II